MKGKGKKHKTVFKKLGSWLSFFGTNINEEMLKELIEMDRAIGKVNERLNYLAQDKEFLHRANLREIALSDYTTAINDAKDEGELKSKFEIARNLKKMGLSNSQISEATGVDVEELNKL